METIISKLKITDTEEPLYSKYRLLILRAYNIATQKKK